MSPEVQHLENAPIKEALIDIRIKPLPSAPEQSFQNIKQAILDDYPNSRDIQQAQITLALSDSSAQSKQEYLGVAYISKDGKQIFQARINGFTFSRLKPYTSWESIRVEAQRLWGLYRDSFKPEQITRLAVRYINRLELQSPLNFSDYLTAPPNKPKNTPEELISFLTRNVVPISKYQAITILTQAMEQVTKENKVPIIIDIDVFVEKEFDVTENFWEILDGFREIKNQFFFGSITDKAMEMYK